MCYMKPLRKIISYSLIYSNIWVLIISTCVRLNVMCWNYMVSIMRSLMARSTSFFPLLNCVKDKSWSTYSWIDSFGGLGIMLSSFVSFTFRSRVVYELN